MNKEGQELESVTARCQATSHVQYYEKGDFALHAAMRQRPKALPTYP
jgi:hypothetical protein